MTLDQDFANKKATIVYTVALNNVCGFRKN